ncbi:HNH endonuclease (plasmid) [Deinococcus radiomollis]|uniref:HNH endonuclease n=1 Tax=Deinococcus radiomollis TaxID=468916 RepID=UPI003892BA70
MGRKQYLQVWDKKTGRKLLYHRQLAAACLGRQLEPGEIVHHRDGDSTNNTRDNLLVLPSQRYHAHIEHLLRCERRGQVMLFPEFLSPIRQQVPGSLFENLLIDMRGAR